LGALSRAIGIRLYGTNAPNLSETSNWGIVAA
jgi:hypothetical protein